MPISRAICATTGAAPVGAAAHAGGDEYHVGSPASAAAICSCSPRQPCGRSPGSRLRPDPGQLLADLDLGAGLREVQRLHIRVYRNKFERPARQVTLDHAVFTALSPPPPPTPMTLILNYIIQALFKLKPIVDILRFIVKDRTDTFNAFDDSPAARADSLPYCYNSTSIFPDFATENSEPVKKTCGFPSPSPPFAADKGGCAHFARWRTFLHKYYSL